MPGFLAIGPGNTHVAEYWWEHRSDGAKATSEVGKFGLFPGSFGKRGRGRVHTGSRDLASALAHVVAVV